MSNALRMARLQALLKRVRRNIARPRPTRIQLAQISLNGSADGAGSIDSAGLIDSAAISSAENAEQADGVLELSPESGQISAAPAARHTELADPLLDSILEDDSPASEEERPTDIKELSAALASQDAQQGSTKGLDLTAPARPRLDTLAGEDIFEDDEIVELSEDDEIVELEEIGPASSETLSASANDELEPVLEEVALDSSRDIWPDPSASSIAGATPDANAEPNAAQKFNELEEDTLLEAPAADAGGLDFDDEADISSVQPAVGRGADAPEHSSVYASSARDEEVDIEFDLIEPLANAASSKGATDAGDADRNGSPHSSPRHKLPELDSATDESALEELSPITAPPESGRQPTSTQAASGLSREERSSSPASLEARDDAAELSGLDAQAELADAELVDEGELEEALVLDSAPEHEPLEADLSANTTSSTGALEAHIGPSASLPPPRPPMPTIEQLGQTVELTEAVGDSLLDLELDPTASAEVAQSQGPRVILSSPPPEELELSLPSRPSGAFDIGLKPPPEAGAELAELRRREGLSEPPKPAPVELEPISTESPASSGAVKEASSSPESLSSERTSSGPELVARAPVEATDSIVAREGEAAKPTPYRFSAWLNASLSLSNEKRP